MFDIILTTSERTTLRFQTGLVNLDKKLETRELEPGEMQVIEMAICGLTIPYTKVQLIFYIK